jgi:hypothetical protein
MSRTVYPQGVPHKYARGMRPALAAALAALLLPLGVTACSTDPAAKPTPPGRTASAPEPRPSPPGTSTSAPAAERRAFDPDRAFATVRRLAAGGPRLATGPAFADAAAVLSARLTRYGYDVRRQPFPVPAGDSWGVPVGAGRSFNLVATPRNLAPGPYVVVGAHLDTVAVSPGAEDNASGVAVVSEVARVLGGSGQVVLVLFGGEEPRGPGDLHHFGSRHFVAGLSRAERRDLAAMVALDRVGAGDTVPLAHVEGTPAALRDRLARHAERLRIPTALETDAASDHESFADAGFAAARIGSTPYGGYHSAGDLPRYVGREQLGRVGRLLIAWLRGS